MDYVWLWLNIAGTLIVVLLTLGIIFSPLFLAFYLVMRVKNHIWARITFAALFFIQIVNLIFMMKIRGT